MRIGCSRDSMLGESGIRRASFRSFARPAAFLFLLLGPLHVASEVHGQYLTDFSIQCGKATLDESTEAVLDPRPKRNVEPLNLRAHEQMQKLSELMDEEAYEDAREMFDRMLSRTRNYTDHEIASIHQLYAKFHFDLEDQESATKQLEQMLNYRESINYAMEETVLFQLAQLYLVQGRNELSLSTILEWLDLVLAPGPSNYFFVSQVYFTLENFPMALQYGECAIALAYQRDYLPIKESWWTWVSYMNYELEYNERVLEIIKILVREHSKPKYWVQLAGVYGELERDKEQVWTFEIAHVGGFLLKQSEVKGYSQLLAGQDAYIRAAWYLDEGVQNELVEADYKTLNQLGQLYHSSFEVDKAIHEYELAAPLSDDGELFYRLATQYYDLDRFEDCITATDQAFDKGDLKRPTHVKYLAGICTYELHKLSEARKIFVDVRSDARKADDENYAKIAGQWITLIDREQERLDELDRMLRELEQT